MSLQVGFLENLVKVFPSLATRPFYLTGESYAGRYIVSFATKQFSFISFRNMSDIYCQSAVLHVQPPSQAVEAGDG